MPVRAEGKRLPAKRRAWPVPWSALQDLARLGWLDLDELEGVPEPRWRTPTPQDRPEIADGAWFDLDRVVRVLDACSRFAHTKGRWARRPFRLDAWQVAYVAAPVFGWVREETFDDGETCVVRVVQLALIEIPRKNGKSTLASAFALVLATADGEAGAEVYAAATSRDQARIVYNEARSMAETSVDLRGKVQPLASVLRVPGTGAFLRVLSRVGDAAHGLNVHGAVIDELHVHKSRGLADAIITGTIARAQPLVIVPTTADEGDDTTIYAEIHNDVVALSEAQAADDLDPATYGVIFAADEDADPFAEDTWRTANPGYGRTVTNRYFQNQTKKAKRLPSYLPVVERLNLNLRRRADGQWLPLPKWDLCTGSTTGLRFLEECRGATAYGGLDLGSTDDFTAYALVIPWLLRWEEFDLDGNLTGNVTEVDGYRLVVRSFVPSAALEKRPKARSALERWAAQGWLKITPGDATDYQTVRRDFERDAEAVGLVEFAFDPWQSETLRQQLEDGGLVGWKCSQKMSAMAPPSRELEKLILGRAIDHGGNPVLRWMVRNTVAKRDDDGNVKPDKRRSAEKIDGVVASVMAIAAAIRDRGADDGKTGFAMVIGADT